MVNLPGIEPDPELGELRAFADVREFPSRVQCAMLAWDALRSVLRESPGLS
jgi:NifU-like protein involved in Fe-S cluster formation